MRTPELSLPVCMSFHSLEASLVLNVKNSDPFKLSSCRQNVFLRQQSKLLTGNTPEKQFVFENFKSCTRMLTNELTRDMESVDGGQQTLLTEWLIIYLNADWQTVLPYKCAVC